MLLDVGVSGTKISDEDYDDDGDMLAYIEENFDDFHDIEDEDIENNNYEETNLNFTEDVSKIAINEILNEMRMSSPIENDLLNDLFNEETTNNIYQLTNADLEGITINSSNSYNYQSNQNFDFNEQIAQVTNDSNLLDQFIYPESCSTPDQLEFNDEVQFKYDASDQFNVEPDIILTYPEVPDSALIANQDCNKLTFQENLPNSSIAYNGTTFQPYLNESKPDSNIQYFECSTNLPMNADELQYDIEKYLSSEQTNNYASFYEFANTPMINDTTYKQSDNKLDFPYNSEMLKEYMSEQNRLFQSLEPINPIGPRGSVNLGPSQEFEIYQCNSCSFYSHNQQELSVHMCLHAQTNFNECTFTTTNTLNLRQQQMHNQGMKHNCGTCDFVTTSRSKMTSHVNKEH